MAVDIFLRLDGIPGESTDRTHAGEIEVLSCSWGVSNTPSTAPGGPARAGRPTRAPIAVTVPTSRASVPLFLACAAGRVIAQGVVTLRRTGEEPFEFLTISLTDVVVLSQDAGASGGDDVPAEAYSLDYRTISFSYVAQQADGTPAEAITGGFDFVANRTT